VTALRGAAPLLPAALAPDADEAREWAERELADPAYRSAEPTAFDRFARAVGDFFVSLFSGEVPAAFGPWFAVVVLVVIAALIGVAFAVWGRPRSAARSRAVADLFGAAEARPAADLRRAAETAARRAMWEEAIVLRVRALARGLSERTIIETGPGATVHRFAARAARVFPDEAPALGAAADAFDDVRYLRRPGTEESYRAVAALDDRLAAAVPRFDAERVPV